MLVTFGKSEGCPSMVNLISLKAFLLPEMIYTSSVLTNPPEIFKEFKTLVFQFLWNGKDKVIRPSTLAPQPYESGDIKMVNYENIAIALRLNWLRRKVDDSYYSFRKLYLTVFYKRYYSSGIKYAEELLHGKANIDSLIQ